MMTVATSSTGHLTAEQYERAAALLAAAGSSAAEVREISAVIPMFARVADAMEVERDRLPITAAAAAAAARAACPECPKPPGPACAAHPVTGAPGFHLSRFGQARRCGLISADELDAVFAAAGAFTAATVLYTADGAR